VSGYIHHFSDEKQAGRLSTFHGFSGEFIGIDASDRDLGLGVTFRAHGKHRPCVDLALPFAKRSVGPGGRTMRIQPAGGQTSGESFLQFGSQGNDGSRRIRLQERRSDFAIRRKIRKMGCDFLQ
jgi:hypothetical protein